MELISVTGKRDTSVNVKNSRTLVSLETWVRHMYEMDRFISSTTFRFAPNILSVLVNG